MGTFHVVINGHLDLTKKPKDLPDTIKQLFVDEVQSPQDLIKRIYDRLKEIIDTGGMGCRLGLENTEVGKKHRSIFVPMHMITFLEAEIKPLVGDIPQENPEIPGEFVDRNGNKVGVQ